MTLMENDKDFPPTIFYQSKESTSPPSHHLLKFASSGDKTEVRKDNSRFNYHDDQDCQIQKAPTADSMCSGYSPPTPPNTPKKLNQQPKTEQDLMKASIDNRFNDAKISSNPDRRSRLSPLTISTDFPPCGAPTFTSISPFIQADPNCLKSPLIVSLPFHEDMGEEEIKRNRNYIAKVIQGVIQDSYPREARPKDTEDNDDAKPFPLQDPPKFKLKRQISTDSNDSSDIKYFEKGPIKRLQSVPSQSSNDSPSEENKPSNNLEVKHRSHFSRENMRPEYQVNENSTTAANEITLEEKPYANNVRWVIKANDPSPSKEEDFHEVRSSEDLVNSVAVTSQTVSNIRPQEYQHTTNPGVSPGTFHRQGNDISEKERVPVCENVVYRPQQREFSLLEKQVRQTSFQSSEKAHHISEEELHRDMFQFQGRDANPQSSATTLSMRSGQHGQLVTEKGFKFPPRATTESLIPITPRIVTAHYNPPYNNIPTDRGPIYRHQLPKSPTRTTVQSSRDRNDEQTLPYLPHEASNRVAKYSQIQRKFPLRSNSDIDHSPSKNEIEELRRYEQSIRRSFSDPSSTPPKQKEMLSEERMRELIPGNDEVFTEEDYNLSHAQQFNRQNDRKRFESEIQYLYAQQYHGRENNMHRVPYDLYQSRNTLDYRMPPVDVKRQLFHEGNQQLSTQSNRGRFPGERRSSRGAQRDQIPDHIARFLISRNLCTQSDIASFNDRERSIEDSESSFSEREMIDFFGVNRGGGLGVPYPGTAAWNRYFDPDNDCRQLSNPYVSPYSTPPQRRRQKGDVDLHVTCTDIAIKTKDLQESLKKVDHSEKNCSCANVENEILNMARDAYKKIRRHDDTKKSFEQFENELQETNSKIFDAMNILCNIKALCKHGRTIQDITTGSVVFKINCPTSFSVRDLWQSYKSGKLEKLFNESFVSDALRAKYPDIQIYLNVEAKREQFEKALLELGLYVRSIAKVIYGREKPRKKEKPDNIVSPGILDNSLSKSDTEIASINSESAKENVMTTDVLNSPALSAIHIRSHSAPITHIPSPLSSPSWIPNSPKSPLGIERKFFPSAGEKSPRRVMKEINMGKDVPCSPTMKKLFDFDLTLSPTTSPKRKTFEGLPWEHDNYLSEVQSPKRKNFGNAFPLKDKSNDA